MIQVRPIEPGLALPNDQDASGRSLGEAELARLADVISVGHAHEHQGRAGSRARGALRGAARNERGSRVLVGNGGDPRRDRRNRSGTGR